MSLIAALCFLIVFAFLMASVSFGLRFYEGQRKKRLVSMLRTVTGSDGEQHVNLLVDRKSDRDTVESILGNINFSDRIANLLNDSGLDWTPTRLAVTSGVTFTIGAVAGALIPIVAPVLAKSLLAGGCAAYLPLMYVKKKKSSRIDALEAQLPDALDFLARSMRAGHAFTISLEMVGEEIPEPLGQEFRALFNEQNLGASLERSFLSFGRRVPLPDVRFFSSAVLLQRQTGGNLSEILNRLSHIIRERFRLKGQVKAVSAHGRMTAMILTLLPVATIGGLMLTSPGYLTPMLTNSIGQKLVIGGVVAQILGNFFIRKIIRIKV